MKEMQTVFLVQHVHTISGDEEDIKTIGIYSSRKIAEEAVKQVGKQEGFRDHLDGFSIDEYKIDSDYWEEGFVTV